MKMMKRMFSSAQMPTCLSPTPMKEETDILGHLSIRIVGISCVPPPVEGFKDSTSEQGLTAEDRVPSLKEEMKQIPSEKAPASNGEEEKRPRRFSIQENDEKSRPFNVFEKGSFHLDSLVESGVMLREMADK